MKRVLPSLTAIVLMIAVVLGITILLPKQVTVSEIDFVANWGNTGQYMTLDLHLTSRWIYFEDDASGIYGFRTPFSEAVGRMFTMWYRGEISNFHINVIASNGKKEVFWLKRSASTS